MTEQHDDANERRKQERFSLETFLAVYRRDDNSQIGHIIDISRGGMLLISTEQVPLNESFDVLLEIGLADNLPKKVAAKALSIWHRKDPNPGFFNNGFKFTDLPAETEQAIGQLIVELQAL
jgi:c-di-GMP-binding flagellar brake protein YcgR